ncbi:ATP-binding protein [Halomonas sp. HMF6819]|uniref:sensor histidine kinase n=1 Tax=Halomonas sp. HMF6819 TaxID=3373085 RepID=UPI0037B90E7C
MNRFFRRGIGLALTVALSLVASQGQAQPTFDEFFEKSSVPMWMVATDNGDIVRANPAAKAFYGYSDLERMNINEINTFTQEQIRDELNRVSREERNHLIFRHRLADGSINVVGVYTQPFDDNGRSTVLSTIVDLSFAEGTAERRYVESVEQQVDLQMAALSRARERARWFWIGGALAQALVILLLILALVRLRGAQRENVRLIDELSFRNQELERLSQAMAHHFQEPSRRLVSFARQLRTSSSEPADSAQGVAIHFISTQAQRLSELVGDVQRYLSVGNTKVINERVDVAKLLNELYRHDPLLEPLRESESLTVDGALPKAYFDYRLLTQIFKLLLHNAWQYRDPARSLEVIVSGTVSKGRAYYRVIDNGQGIAPEYREQVFDMFTRLVPNGDAYPGTGVGLATVVKTLREADGRIVVEDGKDGGACFVFDLPFGGANHEER